jgi:signal transduction histidine kinase
MGLSLNICLGIINEHGGRIWAESEPDKGSSFIIELPAYVETTPENDD